MLTPVPSTSAARPKPAGSHAALADHLAERLACYGIDATMTGNDAATVTRLKEAVGIHFDAAATPRVLLLNRAADAHTLHQRSTASPRPAATARSQTAGAVRAPLD